MEREGQGGGIKSIFVELYTLLLPGGKRRNNCRKKSKRSLKEFVAFKRYIGH